MIARRLGKEIHVCVLMDNHYHLLVWCLGAELNDALAWLQATCAVRLNWAHRRRGPVFQERFKSVLIWVEAA